MAVQNGVKRKNVFDVKKLFTCICMFLMHCSASPWLADEMNGIVGSCVLFCDFFSPLRRKWLDREREMIMITKRLGIPNHPGIRRFSTLSHASLIICSSFIIFPPLSLFLDRRHTSMIMWMLMPVTLIQKTTLLVHLPDPRLLIKVCVSAILHSGSEQCWVSALFSVKVRRKIQAWLSWS